MESQQENEQQIFLRQVIKPFKLSGITDKCEALPDGRLRIKIPFTFAKVSPIEYDVCKIEEAEDLDPSVGAQDAKCLIGEFYVSHQRVPVRVWIKEADDVCHYRILTN